MDDLREMAPPPTPLYSIAETDLENVNVGRLQCQLHDLHVLEFPLMSMVGIDVAGVSGWLYKKVATSTTVEPRMKVTVI